jgi:hypothetical protein
MRRRAWSYRCVRRCHRWRGGRRSGPNLYRTVDYNSFHTRPCGIPKGGRRILGKSHSSRRDGEDSCSAQGYSQHRTVRQSRQRGKDIGQKNVEFPRCIVGIVGDGCVEASGQLQADSIGYPVQIGIRPVETQEAFVIIKRKDQRADGRSIADVPDRNLYCLPTHHRDSLRDSQGRPSAGLFGCQRLAGPSRTPTPLRNPEQDTQTAQDNQKNADIRDTRIDTSTPFRGDDSGNRPPIVRLTILPWPIPGITQSTLHSRQIDRIARLTGRAHQQRAILDRTGHAATSRISEGRMGILGKGQG